LGIETSQSFQEQHTFQPEAARMAQPFGNSRKVCAAARRRATPARDDVHDLVSSTACWHSSPSAAMSKRVLIVDDNQDLAENIAEILALKGYLTEIATSAEEALPRVLPDGPGILVTDYRLPGMTGADLVREIRQRRAALRAVVMSAYTDEGTISAARTAGADFLPKPVDFASLSDLLAAV
jgi:CheY-like chemotaxis protein